MNKYGIKNMDNGKDYLFNTKEKRDNYLTEQQLNNNFWNTYTFLNVDNKSIFLGK